MAAGRLGVANLAATTNTTVYTAPAHVWYSEVEISVLNPNGADATVQLAIATTGTPSAAEYIEKGATVFANGGVIVRENVKLAPGENVVAYSSAANVVVRVAGVERNSPFNG